MVAMMLSTSIGEFPVPPAVAVRLPKVPTLPDPNAPDARRQTEEFRVWLSSSPDHLVSYERLRRWQVVQDELARTARNEGRPFVVSDDGLD